MEQTVKLKKGQFLKELAQPATKAHARATVILTFLCIALMFFSLYLSCVTPIDELPMVSSVLELAGGKSFMSELKTEVRNAAADLDLLYANADDSITPNLANYMAQVSASMKVLAADFSLWNLQSFANLFADVPTELAAVLDAESIALALSLAAMINVIIVCIGVALAFPMLLTALGGFCRVTALTVIGMILSIAITLALFMTPLFLLYQLLQILLIVFVSKVNKAYKAYKRAPVVPVVPAEPAPIAE